MKQTVRNHLVLGTFALAMLAASGGCSDDGGSDDFQSFGNTGNPPTSAGTSSSGGSSAGTFSNAGTPSTSGSPGSAGVFGVGGMTPTTGGTFGAGGATGGASGGAGGSAAGAGGSAAGMAGTGGGGSCPAPTGVHTGTAFTRTCFSITASHCANTADNKDPPANALDGDTMKRWSTGGAMDSDGKYTFTVNLGSAVMVSGVLATTMAGDAPPMIEVSVSTDGNAFTPVACGAVAADIDVGFAPVSAQYVRLSQKGIKTPNWWSIHELNVYGTGTTCGGGGTGTHVCTVNVQ